MAAKRYTQAELDIIKEYYPKYGSYTAWRALRIKGYNRSHRAVQCTCRRHKIRCINPNLNKGKNKSNPQQTKEHKDKLRGACDKVRICYEVGAIRKTAAGTLIKIALPDKWVKYNRYLYEQHYGEIPAQHLILYKDGNPDNIVIENLYCMSKSDHSKLLREADKFRRAELNTKAMETRKANRRAALRQRYGSISEALAAGETL